MWRWKMRTHRAVSKSKDKYESGWVKKWNESIDERSKDEEWELTEL